jgi:NADPH:quinone reductase-like Zn-dependent oxidoreductase
VGGHVFGGLDEQPSSEVGFQQGLGRRKARGVCPSVEQANRTKSYASSGSVSTHCTARAQVLREVAWLVDSGKLRPLLDDQRFSPADIAAAHALVESGALGKVVIEF